MTANSFLKVGLLTISDRAYKGKYEDQSGVAMKKWLQTALLGDFIRAVLVNSGQSLAGMGKQGITINKAILKITSQKLQIPADAILTSSTGVIGAAPDIQKIEKALPFLEKTLTFNPEILLFKSVVIIALAKFSGLKVSVFSKKGKAFSIF